MERAPLHCWTFTVDWASYSPSDACSVWTHTVSDQTMSCSVFSKVCYLRLVLWSQALVAMLPDGALLGGVCPYSFWALAASTPESVWGICSVCPEKLSSALAVSLGFLSRGKPVLTSPGAPVTRVLRGAPGYSSWWWWWWYLTWCLWIFCGLRQKRVLKSSMWKLYF